LSTFANVREEIC